VKKSIAVRAAIAAFMSLGACDRSKPADKAYVTAKVGKVTTDVCPAEIPWAIRTKTGSAGEVFACMGEQEFNMYNVGNVYP
jgi:hypothetical protein